MAASGEGSTRGRRQPHPVLLAGLAFFVLLSVAQALSFWPQVNDDAYITFRHSHSLASGEGPYFNDGERVEGYTNFLLMLLAAGVISVSGAGAAAPAAKALGVACGAGGVLIAFGLARLLVRGEDDTDRADLAGLGAAGLIALSPTWALNSTTGLETTLFGFLLGLGTLLGLQADRDRRWRGAGFAFAAAALTRPEGAFLFAVFWLARAAVSLPAAARAGGPRAAFAEARARGLIADGLIVTGVFVLHMAFRFVTYDGEWLPNTYYAKIGGFSGISAWEYLFHGGVRPFFGWAGVTLAATGLALSRPRLPLVVPLVVVSVVGVAEPLWASVDWMPGWRLIVPFLPLMAAWIVTGWGLLLERARPLRRAAPFLLLAAVPAFWLWYAPERETLLEHSLWRAQGFQTGHRALAEWLASGAARPGEVVALMDIGLVGYLNPGLRILDLTGLTDRHIAKSPGAFLDKSYDPAYVLDQRPRHIVLVFGADGRSYQKPTGPARFEPWTPIEDAIFASEEFQRWYVAKPPAAGARAVWPQDLGQALGAERIFEHATTGKIYLLVVFRRLDRAAA
jgi:hypothetical protein